MRHKHRGCAYSRRDKGGCNDESNGIPVCFDCHQEIGAYDPSHPKGNKFSPAELIARRNRIYELVETGAIFSQLVAVAAHAKGAGSKTAIPAHVTPAPASGEAKQLLAMMLDENASSTKFAGKIKMLSSDDRAHVLDDLAKAAPDNARAVEVLMQIATSPLVTPNESKVVIERTIRHVTMCGTTESKAAMLKRLPPDFLLDASEELREALFEEAIDTIKSDQFNEVNELVPALESHVLAVPSPLHLEFVLAILDQSRSESYEGAPAAKRILKSLPHELARTAIQTFDGAKLTSVASRHDMKAFVTAYKNLATADQVSMLDDFLQMSETAFCEKYVPDQA